MELTLRGFAPSGSSFRPFCVLNMKSKYTVLLVLGVGLVAGCHSSNDEIVRAEAHPETEAEVKGLRCRLFLHPLQSQGGPLQIAGSSRIPNLVFEIENVGDRAFSIPVYLAYPPIPRLRLEIREHPEVQSPIALGNAVHGSYRLKPREKLVCNVSADYHVAFGRKKGSDWVHFDPEDRLYHLTATVKVSSGELVSNVLSTRLKQTK
jgi:hypothetical protein